MRRRGCLTTLLVLVLVVGVVLGIEYGVDYLLFAPWAYGIFGQPTLTGNWKGTVKTHSGLQYTFYLQLDRNRDSDGVPTSTRGNADLDGHLSWCARGIPSTTASVFGFANRSASAITLEANEIRNPPQGLYPLDFHGSWHAPTLVLRVTFSLVRGHGYVYSSAIPDEVHPVRLTLHKRGQSAYQEVCGSSSK